MNSLRTGLYAVTPDPTQALDFERIYSQVEFALRADVISLLQFRSKSSDLALKQVQAARLLSLCKRYACPLIINDELPIAEALGIGLHLGSADADWDLARSALGPKALIGFSCYGDLELAQKAIQAQASYLAFGAYKRSPTKPEASTLDTEVLTKAVDQFELPICVIGGIEAGDWPALATAGVTLAACVSGLFDPKPAVFQQQVLNWREVLDR